MGSERANVFLSCGHDFIQFIFLFFFFHRAVFSAIFSLTALPVLSLLLLTFYPRDAMLARVFAIATCPSVRPSVCPPRAGIVPSRAKAGS